MSPEQLNAILLDRIQKQDALIAAQSDRIAALETELREWKSGSVGPTNRQRSRTVLPFDGGPAIRHADRPHWRMR